MATLTTLTFEDPGLGPDLGSDPSLPHPIRSSAKERIAQKELEGCTFKPKLVSKRSYSPMRTDTTSVFKRLSEGSAGLEAKQRQIRASMDKDNTFSPDLTTKHHRGQQRSFSAPR